MKGAAPPYRRRLVDVLEQAASAFAPALVSVAVADLPSGEEAFVRADEPVHAASTMKLAVLAAAHRLAAAGELRLEDPVLVEVEDAKAHARGLDSTATARGLLTLLRALAEGRLPGSAEMLDLLERAEPRDGIPAALPPGTRVAHKPGRIARHSHDAALVFPPGRPPYALAVLTRGFQDEASALAAIRGVSRLVWNHLARSA